MRVKKLVNINKLDSMKCTCSDITMLGKLKKIEQTVTTLINYNRYKNDNISLSILYADIVNFTPLSEQLSASNLVKILNELFGRFDQIAQVTS